MKNKDSKWCVQIMCMQFMLTKWWNANKQKTIKLIISNTLKKKTDILHSCWMSNTQRVKMQWKRISIISKPFKFRFSNNYFLALHHLCNPSNPRFLKILFWHFTICAALPRECLNYLINIYVKALCLWTDVKCQHI